MESNEIPVEALKAAGNTPVKVRKAITNKI